MPEKPDIPIEYAKVIDSAWEYLATDSRTFFRHRRQDDNNSLHLRPGVWRSNEFAEGILESARKLSGGNNPDLVALLKINRRKLKGGASYTTNMFALESGCGALDISRYKSMEIAASPRFWHEEGKYFVTLQGSSNTNRYDVTEHVKKLLGNSGANANYSDGLYHSCKLKAEDAIWALSPSLSIVVRYITLRHPESEQGDSSFTCYILRL